MQERYVKLMDNLAYIMKNRREFMRAKAYANACETISNFNGPITCPEDLRGLPNIGKTIQEKLDVFTKTGTLPILEEESATIKRRDAMAVFMDIYGVGEKKAEEIVKENIFTIEELGRRKDLLNDKQLIGLAYYHDILKRIPRKEIDAYNALFRKLYGENMEIVGSYRRGKAESGDIDVILTGKESEYVSFIDELVNKKVILEVLSRGPTKCLVIAKLPRHKVARRVDFLFTPASTYPFALLYFTGSKEFNTGMRERALKMGYTLNEHGFSKMDGRKKGAKVDRVFVDERAIFDFLKMKYKEPFERIEGAIEDNVLSASSETPENIVNKITQIKQRAARKDSKKKQEKVEDTEKPKDIKPKDTEKPKDTKSKNVSKKVTSSRRPSAKANIEAFVSKGIHVLESLSEKELGAMIKAANDAFHTKGTPIMEDNAFDIMREYVEKKYPKSAALKEVGAAIVKNKVKLPYEMWSMDKIKPDSGILESWKAKYAGPYVISCKLDGVSGLFTTEGDEPKLYTRGDGKVGQDVSHIIPYLQLPEIKGLVMRGEFIIKKTVFETKYKSDFANPRNLVAGIVNQKTKDVKKYGDLDFVAYEVIKHPDYPAAELKPSLQMSLMEQMNTHCVQHKSLSFAELTNPNLSDILVNWRAQYGYEIDGIIVSNDAVYPRSSGNPKHAFAFKMVLSDQVAEAHVVDVLWSASKDGYLKPRVQIDPVVLGGVTITYATGFNAAFIEKNRIGVGAVIMLVRSGDVIPYIKSVTTPASKAKMPDVEYVYNDTGVDIMLKDKTSDSVVLEKSITQFFKGIEVDGMGPGNVKKLIDAGYNSICKIVHITKEQLLGVEGFKEKMADKLHEGIQTKVKDASIVTLAAMSNTMGRGFSEKKIQLICDVYPNIFKDKSVQNVNALLEIKGIEQKTAQLFIDNIPNFLEFLRECGLESKLDERVAATKVTKSHPLSGKTIVMTGFRDKELEKRLKEIGVKVGSSVSKNTDILLVKSLENGSGKVDEAKKLGIKIVEVDKFEL